MTVISTDVWRRELEPIDPRSNATEPQGSPHEAGTIYDVLREILPDYDIEAVAERAVALNMLVELGRTAAEREQRLPSRPDSAEEQAARTAISEALAPGQLDSIDRHDDPADE
jgi:hypothetical protein